MKRITNGIKLTPFAMVVAVAVFSFAPARGEILLRELRRRENCSESVDVDMFVFVANRWDVGAWLSLLLVVTARRVDETSKRAHNLESSGP